MKELRISEALKVGWEGMLNNLGGMLIYAAIFVVLKLVGMGLTDLMTTAPLLGALCQLALGILNILVGLCLLLVALKIAEARGAKIGSFFDLDLSASLAGRYFITQLLYVGAFVLIACVGVLLVLLFVGTSIGVGALANKEALLAFIKTAGLGLLAALALAGVALSYLMICFTFALPAVLHQGLGPFEAFRESLRLTEGARSELLLMYLAFAGVLLAGFCCLIVGVIPAALVIVIAKMQLYLEVFEQSGPGLPPS